MRDAFRIRFQAMGGDGEFMIAAVDETQARRLAQAAIDEVRRIEHKYSRYREDSIVSRLNAAAGGPAVECDEETLQLLDYADTLYGASGGRFDITSGVLRRAWDFRVPRVPSSDELAPLLALVGWPEVERRGARVRLPRAGMQIDFGGFGKEYAADRAGALLSGRGLRHGYVNLAGDLRVVGPRPDGSAWAIGIQHPRQPGALVASLPMYAGGLATSGDYERGFDLDGRRWCHILDARSGMPVSAWQSVSVRAPLAVAAGTLSTIAMLLEDEALPFLESSGHDYLAIDRHGTLHQRAFPGPPAGGEATRRPPAATPHPTPT
jgi:thiamine biosynthesis lipoprotein